ncbi:hypothetical protein, partial [Bacillus anthracis]|uniref:hypothetical protein n=2 Tax=Bacillus cereus group TaxID=86661 RepID=UPI002FBD72A3
EVKLSSADGSWDLVPVRVGRRQATKNTSLLTCVFSCLIKRELFVKSLLIIATIGMRSPSAIASPFIISFNGIIVTSIVLIIATGSF